jgi:hypothetical protein
MAEKRFATNIVVKKHPKNTFTAKDCEEKKIRFWIGLDKITRGNGVSLRSGPWREPHVHPATPGRARY